MATAAMAYGERRFGAAYTVRIFLALAVLGLVVGLWAAQDDPRTSAHPNLLWVSIGLVFAVAALWVVLGKSVLIINDSGVHRESVLGQQEIAWSQIMETLYRVVPIQRVRAFRTDRSGAHHVDQVRRRTRRTLPLLTYPTR